IAGRPVVVWESPDGEALAGIGSVWRVVAEGPDRFEAARRRLDTILARAGHRGPTPEGFPGAVAFGGFAFAESSRRGWPGFPGASFWLPERIFWRRSGGATIETRWSAAASGPSGEEPERGVEDGPGWDRDAWIGAVCLTLDRIRSGALRKAV